MSASLETTTLDRATLPPSDCFTGDIVQIDVGLGNNRRTFLVHKNVLCHYSGYFAGALRGNFIEAITNRVELAAEDSAIFAIFVYWLYTRRFPSPDGGDQWCFLKICKLWVLGDARGIPLLQNDSMALLIRTAAEKNMAPISCNDYVYRNTLPGSPLRRAVIDLIGKMVGVSALRSPSSWNREALFDLAKANWTDRKLVLSRDILATIQIADYHVNEDVSKNS